MRKKKSPNNIEQVMALYPIVEEGGEPMLLTEPFDVPHRPMQHALSDALDQMLHEDSNISAQQHQLWRECRRIAAFDMSEVELTVLAASLIIQGREVEAMLQELQHQLHHLIPALLGQPNGAIRQIVTAIDTPILDGLKAILKASDELLDKSKQLSRLETASKGAKARAKSFEQPKAKVL